MRASVVPGPLLGEPQETGVGVGGMHNPGRTEVGGEEEISKQP